jgi:hypothetical protein
MGYGRFLKYFGNRCDGIRKREGSGMILRL